MESQQPLDVYSLTVIEQHIIDKNEQLASEAGKAGFGLAYVMDGLKEE